MVSLLALAVLAPSQQDPAPTYDSHFVMHDGAAYVLSPVYPLAFKGDRVGWSANSRRAAFVAPTQVTPSRFARAAAAGESVGVESVMVWNAESGRVTEVAVPKDATQGFDKIEFIGTTSDLLITTFWGSSVESTRYGVVYVRDGGTPVPLDLGEVRQAQIAVSHKLPAFLILTDKGAWHVNNGSISKADLPEEVTDTYGVAVDDTALLVGRTDDGVSRYYSYDFGTRRTTMLAELKKRMTARKTASPFLFDALEPTGLKRSEGISEENLSGIDARARRLSNEDGGVRIDVVEREGARRRRVPFIWEMSRYFYPSPDGLSIAFNCQGLLCVRSLIKCDKETTAKLAGTGG